MSTPTVNDVQAVDPILTNMLLGYKQNAGRFVAGQLFPAVPVDKDSGTYYILDQGPFFTDEMKSRAPGDLFGFSGYKLSSTTYTTKQWALAHKIPAEVRANSQVPMDLETIAVEWLGQQSLIRKERQFVSDFVAASVWTTQDNDATTDWDDYAAGDPVNDIIGGKRAISQLIGQLPNVLAVGEIVDSALRNHPDIIDRLKYTTAATQMAIESAMAAVLGIDRYLVAMAIYNSSNPAQTASYSAIFDDDALLLYVAPRPAIFQASAGYTFTWAPGGGDGMIERYYSDELRSDVVRTFEQWDQKQVAAGAGAIWLGVV